MTYIISDIHGEYDLFLKLLDKIKFSASDKLYICGDIVEKGSHSIKLAKLISRLPNAKCIAGNHEYAFLKYYWGLMQSSPSDFDEILRKLQAYFPDDGYLLDWELVDWFEALPYYIEEREFICVHAGVSLDRERFILPLEKATPEQLVYDRTFKEAAVLPKDGKCVFFGHTPTINMGWESKIKPYLREGARGDKVSDYYKIHLDLGTWISGVLGCFLIETCQSFYVQK